MQSKKAVKKTTFEQKIRHAMLLLMVIVTFMVGGVVLNMMYSVHSNLAECNEKTGNIIASISSDANDKQIGDKLKRMTEEKAKQTDQELSSLIQDVHIMVLCAERVYNSPSNYGRIEVYPPQKKDADKLAVQVTYSASVDPEDPDIIEEQELLGNLGNLMYSLNANDETLTSCYFATESGIMLQADTLAAYQFDEKGNVKTFEAKERLWYKGAVENQGLYLSDVFTDADTGEYAVVCSAPFYKDGKLMGVAGAGMLLSNLGRIMENANLTDSGIAMLVTQDGDLISSTFSPDAIATDGDELPNMLENNGEFASLFRDYVKRGGSMLQKIKSQNQDDLIYVSCSMLESTGWVFVSALPESDVNATTLMLKEELNNQNSNLMRETDGYLYAAALWLFGCLVVLLLISAVIAHRLTAKLVQPVNCLTEKVRVLDGGKLEFEWDQTTGDEIDELALSFCHLTKRIKTYIADITAITAEKERIGAELSVATRIQADMLPIVFPPFPERKEFEIYASMTPAKEVGGDFYDFFMIDDDHLALVIADVSGKGVPAALFMVISKTLLKDHAQMRCSPKAILEDVNDLLLESNAEGMFVTVWLGILEISTGKIIAANAGHEYPALRTADGDFELLKDKHGMIVGAMGGIHYKEYELQLERGGCLFVYTDGVPEATNSHNELYGTDRMVAALNQDSHADPKTLLANVRADVDRFVGEAPQLDDLTMLSLRYYEPSAETGTDSSGQTS